MTDPSREEIAFQRWMDTRESYHIISPLEAWKAGIAWHRMLIAHDNTAKLLTKMSKKQLLHIMWEHAKERGATWLIGGPQTWTKDELVNAILDWEYSEVRNRDFPPPDMQKP